MFIVSLFLRGRVIRNILSISMDVRFKTPANFYICGASQCGKSFLVRSMLHHRDELFEPKITKIIFCYGEYQSAFDSMMQTIPNLTFVEGFPENLNDMLCTNCLVIVDDLMSQCSQNQSMSDLFTKGSHHRGVSVIYLTQNLFPPGRQSRTISLNSHYMIVFKHPRDSLGISTLARQMYPHSTNFLVQSFQDATKRPYGYLLFDLHQLTPENMRLRTNILPGEKQIFT